MSHNSEPHTEFPQVPNPKLWKDPNTIRFKELYQYVSSDIRKLALSQRNYKGSLRMIGGILGACLIAKGFADSAAESYVYGENGNGGSMLEMQTKNNTYDYYYNREFQKMRWLTEQPLGIDPTKTTSNEVLADLGYKIEARGVNTQVRKRAPHPKYFY